MKMKKSHLSDISSLIFQGFLTSDVFIDNVYITLKTLTTEEREEISSQFKYLPRNYNFLLILELILYSIQVVGGHKVDKQRIKKFLLDVRSTVVLFLYDQYNEMEKRIEDCIKFVDYYIDSNESKYYWGIFKNTSRDIDLHEIRHVNQFQYYWIVLNSIKDQTNEEKREWSKIEYMTNSICAFVNPKAYRKVKDKMDISKQLDSESRNREILKILEKTGEVDIDEKIIVSQENGLIDANKGFFDQTIKKENESDEEYKDRINEMMKKQCSGDVADEHDKIVRDYELSILKDNLLRKRKEVEIYKYIKKTRNLSQSDTINQTIIKDGILREESSIVGDDDQINKLNEETREGGYFYNGVSYAEVMDQRGFNSIPKVEKERIFNEVMTAELDIKSEADVFLKNLYTDKDNKDSRSIETDQPINTIGSQKQVIVETPDGPQVIEVGLKEEDKFEESEIDHKSAAEKAAHMNVSVDEKDLILEKNKREKEKNQRIQNVLEKRNQIVQTKNDNDNEDLDQIIF